MSSLVLLLSLFSFSWPEPGPGDAYRGLEPADFVVAKTGELRDRNLREASGLAASRRVPGMLWSHNDSGWGPVLYAVGPQGQGRGRVKVEGASYNDWEDLASFEIDDIPYLLIADVGDNNSRRRVVWLHVIEEPKLNGESKHTLEVETAWSIPVHYPGGPADCEAVAVDIENSEVLLLTKRQKPPQLFSVPLRRLSTGKRKVLARKARFVSEVTTIPPPNSSDLVDDPLFGPWRSQPTAMDISSDGSNIVVLTYRHAYLYRRSDDMGWGDALAVAPEIVMLPKMRQPEAIAFAPTGTDMFVTTEKRPSPLYRLSARTTKGNVNEK